jgi:hypothetical protein
VEVRMNIEAAPKQLGGRRPSPSAPRRHRRAAPSTARSLPRRCGPWRQARRGFSPPQAAAPKAGRVPTAGWVRWAGPDRPLVPPRCSPGACRNWGRASGVAARVLAGTSSCSCTPGARRLSWLWSTTLEGGTSMTYPHHRHGRATLIALAALAAAGLAAPQAQAAWFCDVPRPRWRSGSRRRALAGVSRCRRRCARGRRRLGPSGAGAGMSRGEGVPRTPALAACRTRSGFAPPMLSTSRCARVRAS